MIFFLLVGFTNYFILESDFAILPTSTFLVLAIASLWLNKLRKTNASFLLFTLNVNLSIFFVNEYYPYETGAYLFYFPLIVSVVLLNNPSFLDRQSLIHFSVSGLFFITSLLIDFPGFQLQTLSAEQMKDLWYYDFIISAVLTAVLTFLLTRIIYMQNKEIITQNEDLKKAKEAVNLSLKEKEILLAELHHRVKNNLAIISGLLNLQEEATSNNEARQVINDSKTRIMSMALVHKMLYENAELKNINLGKYASDLIYELLYSSDLLQTVSINQEFDTIHIPVNKSIPLGLILNEVMTNCIKYTFKTSEKQDCVFDIRIKLNGNKVNIQAKDNGAGFPRNFNEETNGHSLGIYLIKTLTEQIDGNVHFSNDNGAKIELNFTLN